LAQAGNRGTPGQGGNFDPNQLANNFNQPGNVTNNVGRGGFNNGGFNVGLNNNFNVGNGGAYAGNQGFSAGYTGNVTNPITGNNFADWNNRMGIVQNLVDDPVLRQQIADARAQAIDMRSNYIRHSQLPQWDTVNNNVVAPLNKVISSLRQQLAKVDQPDSLQPVDQDPVPEKYADSVKRYYEALGN